MYKKNITKLKLLISYKLCKMVLINNLCNKNLLKMAYQNKLNNL